MQSELWWIKQKQKRWGIDKSIQVQSGTRFPDICHMHYCFVGQDRDPSDIAGPLVHPSRKKKKMQNPRKVLKKLPLRNGGKERNSFYLLFLDLCCIEPQRIPLKKTKTNKEVAHLSHRLFLCALPGSPLLPLVLSEEVNLWKEVTNAQFFFPAKVKQRGPVALSTLSLLKTDSVVLLVDHFQYIWTH